MKIAKLQRLTNAMPSIESPVVTTTYGIASTVVRNARPIARRGEKGTNMVKKMRLFEINVCRIGYGHASFTVHGRNKKHAEERAFEEAGNHSYSEHSSEYKIDSTVEIKDAKKPR